MAGRTWALPGRRCGGGRGRQAATDLLSRGTQEGAGGPQCRGRDSGRRGYGYLRRARRPRRSSLAAGELRPLWRTAATPRRREGKRSRQGDGLDARGRGAIGGRWNLGAAEGVPERRVQVGLLRSREKPLGDLVPYGRLRRPSQDARLPGAQV